MDWAECGYERRQHTWKAGTTGVTGHPALRGRKGSLPGTRDFAELNPGHTKVAGDLTCTVLGSEGKSNLRVLLDLVLGGGSLGFAHGHLAVS